MNIELCRQVTDDGVSLDGALCRPESPTNALPVDAFLLVHGTGSNFYSPGVLETFARQAVEAGCPALRVNTRGHDLMTSLPGASGRRGGAAYESIAECVPDLRAWIAFLANRGYANIALVGHSMGGVKCLYFASKESHPAVKRIIGIAPPRFCHAHWMAHPGAEPFRESFERATRLIAEGRGDELITVRQPLPLPITAAGFVEKYGPADEYDYIPRLSSIAADVLLIIGSESVATSPAFDSLPAELDALAARDRHIHCEFVNGANTPFRGYEDMPFELTAEWIANRE